MSFDLFKETIELGDTVMLYLGVNSMHAIEVQPKIKNKKDEMVENVFQTTYGALKVKELVGKKFGSKVELSKGWAYVLHPTPELWTLTLPHRTQIIYTPDISMIIFQLEIRPGSIVVESGTGSGSLSHALIRCIKPDGHLYTFDFHAHRASVATAEFESHGVGRWVTVEQRDVCGDGFGPQLEGTADAVFLDLPHPWEAVPHAVSVMKECGGRLVSFSPCIEQVQRTCAALASHGFLELCTAELLHRELQVQSRGQTVLQLDPPQAPAADSRPQTTRFLSAVPPASSPGHTGYLTAATLPPRRARPPPPGPPRAAPDPVSAPEPAPDPVSAPEPAPQPSPQ
ncbi:tRNA (adenine(58)-N(1))-methyltransferase catalytic subunit TRMT61A [Bacillus rossius redtenbacheri]|uniref:tRNA (adenine(58)-N(1))-methyltransferase catalytic subunit TRMT61A n=1 Tax=Bacillus rossius redtenbacheri TaxID=93214 RepID=UPI002FDDA97F